MIYQLHGGPAHGREVAYDKPPEKLTIPIANEPLTLKDGLEFEFDALGNVRPKRMKFGAATYILQNNAYHYQEQTPVTEPDKTDTGRHLGIIKLTRDQLRQALGLPEGTTIVDASFDTYFSLDLITVKVEHPALPLTRPGYAIPHVEALQKTTIHSVETSEFDRWSY